MPIIEVNVLEGRTHEQKEAFVEKVTMLAVKELDARREGVRVLFRELAPEDFGIAGETVRRRKLSTSEEP